MDRNIVILIDDKQEMVSALNAQIQRGDDYAERCIRVLIDEWDADEFNIDKQAMVEYCTGYLVDRLMHGQDVVLPREFVANDLATLSNLGLLRHGLTREQYNQQLNNRRNLQICPKCGQVHRSNDARAINRFSPETSYMAAHGDTPRGTRAEAERDECDWRISHEQTLDR